jgi:hypothetical protein
LSEGGVHNNGFFPLKKSPKRARKQFFFGKRVSSYICLLATIFLEFLELMLSIRLKCAYECCHPNSIKKLREKKNKDTQVRKRNKEKKELIQAKEFKDQSLETAHP